MNHFVRIGIYIFFYFFILFGAFGQETPISFSFSIEDGFYHDPDKLKQNLLQNAPKALGVTYLYKNLNKPWHNYYHFTGNGLSILWLNTGSPKIFGSSLAFIPDMRFALLEKQRFHLGVHFGIGFSYFTRHFHPAENYKNIYIGSPFTAVLNAEIATRFNFHKNWFAFTGFRFVHFSNGETRQPNHALNIMMLKTGISYAFHPDDPVKKQTAGKIIMNFDLSLTTTLGIKQLTAGQNNSFMVYSLTVESACLQNKKRAFTIGWDVVYSAAEEQSLKQQGISFNKGFETLKTGLSFGHTWKMGQLDFLLQTGIYLYNKNLLNGTVYNRFGIRYAFIDNCAFHLCHRSNFFFKGDFIEWGILYRLYSENEK